LVTTSNVNKPFSSSLSTDFALAAAIKRKRTTSVGLDTAFSLSAPPYNFTKAEAALNAAITETATVLRIQKSAVALTAFAAELAAAAKVGNGLVHSQVTATQVTVAALPSTIVNGSTVDFVQYKSPNDLLAFESTITGVAGTVLTFASLPNDLAVGDYICLANQSPVPLIPEELHPVLTQAAMVTCLASKKDKSQEGLIVHIKN
jgi:hypothetical protein